MLMSDWINLFHLIASIGIALFIICAVISLIELVKFVVYLIEKRRDKDE